MRILITSLVLLFALGSCKNSGPATQIDRHDGKEHQTVVLVHGYNHDSRDMRVLAGFLEESGYHTVKVDLPLTFQHVEDSAKLFASTVEEILSGIPEDQTIFMVGHSTGGLVIRYFLSHHPQSSRVGRAVLIATPNQGSSLAELAGEISDLLVETFATLNSLRPENISKLGLIDPQHTQVGAIAGNKGNLVIGQLLEKENDGRVEVHSVFYPGLDAFTVVPYNHHEIHYKIETANLVIRFFETGSFD